MGSWFSNLNIRKNETVTVDAAAEQLTNWLGERQYEPAASAADSEWITVCTDLLTLEEPEQFGTLGTALSASLHADVLGIACFDSDYLWLNLLNAHEKIDGWVGIGDGKTIGLTRRNKLTPWKKRVRDYERFSQCAKEPYILAEAFLADTAGCLGLPVALSGAAVGYLPEIDPEKKAAYLYFRQKEDARGKEKVRLSHYEENLPCLVGRESKVRAINLGAASRGLTIWFLAPGVEEDAVHFSDVCIQCDRHAVPISLSKARFSDGCWGWCWHDVDFQIPPAVTGRMKQEKRRELENQRSITIRFTPRGDSRKTLDIQVGVVPDENPEGGTWWNVWRRFGSKEDFIKWHNKIWKWCWSMKDQDDDERGYLPLLKRTDFD